MSFSEHRDRGIEGEVKPSPLLKDYMKNSLKYSIGFLVAGILFVVFYFLVYKPELESEFKRGLAKCEKDTDTLYLPGKDSVVYRDTSFSVNKPVQVKDDDSSLTLTTSFDTTFVSGKDTIINNSEVKISIKKKEGKWNVENQIAEWLSKYGHKDFMQAPDTIKIYFPKYIEVPIKETNWLITGIAYVAGVVTSLVLFLIAN
jgi:hypothetical protein